MASPWRSTQARMPASRRLRSSMSRGSAPGGFEQDCLVGTKAPQHVGRMTGDDDLPASAGQRPEWLDEHREAKQLESKWSGAPSPRGGASRLVTSARHN